MTFERTLRELLRRDAAAVPMPSRPDPGRAAGRGRALARRQHRTAVIGAAAIVAMVAATPVLLRPGAATLSVGAPGESGLVPTGPVDFDWQVAEGGLSNAPATFQDGIVYALATGPGVRDEEHIEGRLPKALYRLGDDGTWEPLALEGDRPYARDVSGTGGHLYAVSTGPGSGGEVSKPRLSTSDDGGDTWTFDDIAPVEPPSTVVDWRTSTTMAVESSGSTTVAVFTTFFEPDLDSLFPEVGGVGESDVYSVAPGEDGLRLVRNDDDETVRTVRWPELGVDGPEAMAPHHQLFRRTGDAWEPLSSGTEAFASLGSLSLEGTGDRFIVSDGVGEVLVSVDGAEWSEVNPPREGRVVGVGPALVNVPEAGVVLDVSGDGGATWSSVDLSDPHIGIAGDAVIKWADGGPLGLALVLSKDGGYTPHQLAFSSDLVDWTTPALPDVVGTDDSTTVVPFVGDDRIVLRVLRPSGDPAQPVGSRTVVGTPIRGG